MIYGWLITNEYLNGNKYAEINEWLILSAISHNIKLDVKTNGEVLVQIGKELGYKPDFVIFWDKDISLARYLEGQNIPVFNSSKAIEICDNKSYTHQVLSEAGILMPKTIIAPMTYENIGYTNYDFLNMVSEGLGFPMVLKEAFGSFGQQVFLINDIKMLYDKVLEIGSRPMLFQEFVSSSAGRDIRLQVVGNKVITSMYRYSENGDFRANITNGGSMKPYTPSKEQEELALLCCKTIGLDFAGVDMLFGNNESIVVCEVNSNAHFKNIYDCTKINAADAIIEYILEKINFSEG